MATAARLTSNGLEPTPVQPPSLTAAVAYEPADGVYTVTRTYGRTRVCAFDQHLDRLEESARLAGWALNLDRPALRGALRQMAVGHFTGDIRFRVTATPQDPGTLLLTCESFEPPPSALVTGGVACVTLKDGARDHAAIKTTAWMKARAGIHQDGHYETLLLDHDGRILEGSTSNFYVIRGGQLWTADDGILFGIARSIVLAVALELLPVVLAPVRQDALHTIDEAFLTSSSRGIIPIVRIDGQPVGHGTRSPVTAALQVAYDTWVDQHLEEL
jgi:branched-chain amino acid aminotransferase